MGTFEQPLVEPLDDRVSGSYVWAHLSNMVTRQITSDHVTSRPLSNDTGKWTWRETIRSHLISFYALRCVAPPLPLRKPSASTLRVPSTHLNQTYLRDKDGPRRGRLLVVLRQDLAHTLLPGEANHEIRVVVPSAVGGRWEGGGRRAKTQHGVVPTSM